MAAASRAAVAGEAAAVAGRRATASSRRGPSSRRAEVQAARAATRQTASSRGVFGLKVTSGRGRSKRTDLV